jgi:hypothetical protein
VATVISAGQTSTCALEGSTEAEQFEEKSTNGHNGYGKSNGHFRTNGHSGNGLAQMPALFEGFDPEEIALLPSGD